MTLLALAPLAQSYDMFIAIAFCFIPPFIWWYYGLKASKSGSYKKVPTGRDTYKWGDDPTVNVSFWKTAHFYFGALWMFFGLIFFFAGLWPQHHDVWFK
jgi:uncharacterized membrane protein